MEVLGTLVGAAIQGQIVASAHTKKHCPTHNISAGHLGNGSGTEIIKSLLHSQDYLSHSVSVTCANGSRGAQRRARTWTQNNVVTDVLPRSCDVCTGWLSSAFQGQETVAAE